MPYLIFADMQI